jgi:GT2 family glycosyltransferase
MTTSAAPTPAVSVIIPAYHSWKALPLCLTALQRQQGDVTFEVIVVISAADGQEVTLQQRFPTVQILAYAERKFPGQARNLGAQQARGDILLFLDADCLLAADGVERCLQSHRRFSQPLIGGALLPDPAQNHIGWAQYFSSLTAWMPSRDTEPVPAADVATGCCSIKRAAFLNFGMFADIRYGEDTLLSWRITSAGYTPLFDPGLCASHYGVSSFAQLLTRKFWHGRNYASMRAQQQHWSTANRLLRITASPIIPLLLLYRCGRNVWHSGHFRLRFLLTIPATLFVQTAWTLGEDYGLFNPLVFPDFGAE